MVLGAKLWGLNVCKAGGLVFWVGRLNTLIAADPNDFFFLFPSHPITMRHVLIRSDMCQDVCNTLSATFQKSQ